MIISNKRVNLPVLLNFDLLPVLQTLSSDLVDRFEIVAQTPDAVEVRCILKQVVVPLFVHVRVARHSETEFDVANVADPYPGVQLLVRETRCRIRFEDAHTAEIEGVLELQNKLPAAVERALNAVSGQIVTRLKTFIERL